MKLTINKWRCLLICCLCLALPAAAAAFQIGETAPGFTLLNLKGERVKMDDRGDRPLLLELGTTWCPGCRFQSQEVNKVAEHFGPERLAVLEVFIQETEESVRSYITELGGHPENALIDDDTVREGYSIYLIPRVLIIDAEGKVLYDGGMTKAEQLIEKLDSHLNGARP